MKLKAIEAPKTMLGMSVELTEETIHERLAKVKANMVQSGIDTLVIYADKEHGANFEYLTGFIPRFEEALLVLSQTNETFLLLGNENMKMAAHARIPNKAIHVPHFSLPNQPMDPFVPLLDLLAQAKLDGAKTIGLVGWKKWTTTTEKNETLFDIPHFIVKAIQDCATDATLISASGVMIGNEMGARILNNANEVAHYEFGASLSSTSILNAMNQIDVGKSEMELAGELARLGQPHTVISIMATGERFQYANLYPTNKKVRLGDKISLTCGFKGGLSSRAGYAVSEAKELPDGQEDYVERVSGPYFNAVVKWLETVKVGYPAADVYQMVEDVLPKERYHWHLNPGHLTADEEWMSSPIYPNSPHTLKSGMIFQIDIIPSVKGYAGVSAEECVALADASLRETIRRDYPELHERIKERRRYLREVLQIDIHEDILPLSNTVAYLRPYLLNKELAFVNE
ncbi:hypothetical protein X560_2452 [Listeria fleischmannii 1991]|uniref:Xaa-Pro aminopeptidase n=2 Tax=Listeria fleischmannii TaxID=1069827 RepID=A0A2X3IM97_9LIST|nr:aminopeptidase P family protein [Listeria fleischmannii]EMG28422.1 hypothetical protein LFLEISCH_05430 [Listeria fleischmannii subsp. fleischmannii LU2006-1]KMT58011.1 hypothetical protein X560_2452 [Listeria fleischmannii 1991]SQC62139.1 Xaa-Pro aminopeptidase [Listeria fleischmannii subsp. fleischmannii]